MQDMEDRLEKRFDVAVKRFEQVLASGVAKFKCPHELGGA
jgi:hypothetical protein